jgi:hypothetical protein
MGDIAAVWNPGDIRLHSDGGARATAGRGRCTGRVFSHREVRSLVLCLSGGNVRSQKKFAWDLTDRN